jgi:predicted peptidase
LKQALGAVVLLSAAGCGVGSTGVSGSAGSAQGAVKNATAVTEVFGDGLKLTAVALQYEKEIDNSKLASSTFTVDGRTITKVYVTTAPRLRCRV